MSRLIRGLIGLFSRSRVVGTDLQGNQYLEKAARGSGRARRTVKIVGVSTEDQYTEGSIPHEWERWLRGTRQDAPTHEELLVRLKQSEKMQSRITEAEEKDAQLRASEVSDGEMSQRVKVKDHASAPTFRSPNQPGDDPTSTGKDFEPASWKP